MKIMFCLLINVIICFVSLESSQAQVPTWEWAIQIGGTSTDKSTKISLDAAGNVYTIGNFKSTVDFDPGIGIFNLTSSGVYDFFISKLDPQGNFIWAKSIGSLGNEYSFGVDFDALGNVYVSGVFSGTVDFDPGLGINNLTALGGADIFVIKLNNLGNFIWAKTFGGYNDDNVGDLVIDQFNNIYLTGDYRGTSVDFDPGPGNLLLTSNGDLDFYVSKLDSAGNLVWAKGIGSSDGDYGNSLSLDQATGSLYITGEFGYQPGSASDSCDFDPGSGSFFLNSYGNGDAFVLKLDYNGNFIWAKGIQGGVLVSDGLSIAVDPIDGTVYTTGYLAGLTDLDPGTGVFNVTTSGTSMAIFVLKLNSSGNFLWAKIMDGTNYERGNAISTDPSGTGKIYITGYFTNSVDFDPGPGSFILTAIQEETFIVALDSIGNFDWAKTISGSNIDHGTSITVDAFGGVYTTGTFIQNASFDTINMTSYGSADIFIAKMEMICNPSSSILTLAICESFTSPSGNYTWLTSGTYLDTLVNFSGCDSIITINLTILNSPVVTISAMGPTTFCQGDSVLLYGTPGFVSYQWYQKTFPIPGATQANYYVKNKGRFTCFASNGICTDTSNLIQVYVPCVPIGPNQNRELETGDQEEQLLVYPNPGRGQFSVESKTGQLKIYNCTGQLIYSKKTKNSSYTIDLSEYPDGLYSFTLEAENRFQTKKVLLIR